MHAAVAATLFIERTLSLEVVSRSTCLCTENLQHMKILYKFNLELGFLAHLKMRSFSMEHFENWTWTHTFLIMYMHACTPKWYMHVSCTYAFGQLVPRLFFGKFFTIVFVICGKMTDFFLKWFFFEIQQIEYFLDDISMSSLLKKKIKSISTSVTTCYFFQSHNLYLF